MQAIAKANHTLNNFRYLLSAMYMAGIAGAIFLPEGTRDWFLKLTPLTLLFTAFLLVYFNYSSSILQFLIISYGIGFLVEAVGVNTGLIFGNYAYGRILGPKIWNTPIIIGVNWFILAASSYALVKTIFNNHWLLLPAGASLMTLLDYLIEPVAIKLDFWQWYGYDVPLKNYFGWFVTAAVLMWIAKKLNLQFTNTLPNLILKLQFIFFATLLIMA
jgi:putative membrane protein